MDVFIFVALLMIESCQGFFQKSLNNIVFPGNQDLSEDDFKESFSPPDESIQNESCIKPNPNSNKKHRNVIRMACDSETPIAKMTLHIDFEGNDPDTKRHYFILKKTFDPNSKNTIEYNLPEILRNNYHPKTLGNCLSRDDLYYKNIRSIPPDEAIRPETNIVDYEQPVKGSFLEKSRNKLYPKRKHKSYVTKWKESLRNSLKSNSLLNRKIGKYYGFNTDKEIAETHSKTSIFKKIPLLNYHLSASRKNNNTDFFDSLSENTVHKIRGKSENNTPENKMDTQYINENRSKQTLKSLNKNSILFPQIKTVEGINMSTEENGKTSQLKNIENIKKTKDVKYLVSNKNTSALNSDIFKELELNRGIEDKTSSEKTDDDLEIVENENLARGKKSQREKVIKNLKFILCKEKKEHDSYDGKEFERKRKYKKTWTDEPNLGDLIETTETANQQNEKDDYDLYDYDEDETLNRNSVLRKSHQNSNKKAARRKNVSSSKTKFSDVYESHNHNSDSNTAFDEEIGFDDPLQNSLNENKCVNRSPAEEEGEYISPEEVEEIRKGVYLRKGKPLSFRRKDKPGGREVEHKINQQWLGNIYLPKKYAHLYDDPLNDKVKIKRAINTNRNYQKAMKRFMRDVSLFKSLYKATFNND